MLEWASRINVKLGWDTPWKRICHLTSWWFCPHLENGVMLKHCSEHDDVIGMKDAWCLNQTFRKTAMTRKPFKSEELKITNRILQLLRMLTCDTRFEAMASLLLSKICSCMVFYESLLHLFASIISALKFKHKKKLWIWGQLT